MKNEKTEKMKEWKKIWKITIEFPPTILANWIILEKFSR